MILRLCLAVFLFLVGNEARADKAQSADAPAHLPTEDVLAKLPPDDAATAALPLPEKADYYVKTHQWIKLNFLLQGAPNGFKSQEEFQAALDWMPKNLFAGGPIMIAFPQAAAMWAFGEHTHDSEQAEHFRNTAASTILYAVAVSDVDSTRCDDPSVKDQMTARILRDWKPQLQYLDTLPTDRRLSIIDRAMQMEAKTSDLRQEDYSLCSQGLDELKSRSRPMAAAAPNKNGFAGTVVDAPPNQNYMPKFKPLADVAAAQAEARRQLPIRISVILASVALKHP